MRQQCGGWGPPALCTTACHASPALVSAGTACCWHFHRHMPLARLALAPHAASTSGFAVADVWGTLLPPPRDSHRRTPQFSTDCRTLTKKRLKTAVLNCPVPRASFTCGGTAGSLSYPFSVHASMQSFTGLCPLAP